MAITHPSGARPGLPCQNQTAAKTGNEIPALRLTARVARPSGCSEAFSSAFQAACRTAATRTSASTARGTGRVYRGGEGDCVDTSTDRDILDITIWLNASQSPLDPREPSGAARSPLAWSASRSTSTPLPTHTTSVSTCSTNGTAFDGKMFAGAPNTKDP